MRRYQPLLLILISCAMSLPVWSASLDDARQLHEEGKSQEALATIETVLSSGAPEAEKAAALDLLGTIAVEEGQLAMAKQAWARLMDEYPGYAQSHDTATKLSLVSALVKTEEAPAASKTVVSEAAEEKAAAVPVMPMEREPEVPATEPAPAAAPAPALEPSEPASPASPAPTAASDLVLIAARGRPHDAVRDVSDRIVAFLRDNGVNAESATGGIPVVEESKMVLPLLLQKGQQEEVASVLLLTADYLTMQKMVLDCYTAQGAKLWKLKISGGTGWKGRPYSKTGVTEPLLERFLEKLGRKVGEPGLPVTLP